MLQFMLRSWIIERHFQVVTGDSKEKSGCTVPILGTSASLQLYVRQRRIQGMIFYVSFLYPIILRHFFLQLGPPSETLVGDFCGIVLARIMQPDPMGFLIFLFPFLLISW